jgi:hypothetical protein
MIETLFFIPVAAKDSVRAGYAVQSIRKFSEDYRIHLLLDGQSPETLAADLKGDDVRIMEIPAPSHGNWGKIWQHQCRCMIQALNEPDVSAQALFIRMDADAILIRKGASQRARKIFSTRPKAGQIGQTFSSIRGARFHNAGWSNYLRKMMGWRGTRQFLLQAMREGDSLFGGLRAHRDFRAIVNGAIANGYVLGDICLGGFNVMRRELIAAMAARIPVETTPFRYLPIVGDDIVLTLYTYWLDFAPIDDSSDDGLCGVEANRFRMDPFTLKRRGHYALHPLKYGHHADGIDLDEAGLVAALTQT